MYNSTKDRPYLAHIKSLSALWPSLRLLADFMEIGTSPVRWGALSAKPTADLDRERNERAERTKVTRLDYLPSGVVSQVFTTSQGLRDALSSETEESDVSKEQFRLYLVEDLSRDVIELLGGHHDIEPAFFREQIFDYAWYNIRDRWMDSPRLNITQKRQRWLQFRFTVARYYKNVQMFQEGMKEYESFNVLRRGEDDLNNKSNWDDRKAIVSHARSRASLWLSGEGNAGKSKRHVGKLPSSTSLS